MDLDFQGQLNEIIQQAATLIFSFLGLMVMWLLKRGLAVIEQKFHAEKESLLRNALESAMQNALNVGAERLQEAGKAVMDPTSSGQAVALTHILDDAVAYLQKTNPEALATFNLDPVTLRNMVMARAVARADIPTGHATSTTAGTTSAEK